MRGVLIRIQGQWQRWLVRHTPDEEVVLQAYLLNLTLVGLVVAGLLLGLITAILWALDIVPEAAIGALVGFGVQPFCGLVYWLSRRGQSRLAGCVLALVLFVIVLGVNGLWGLGHATLVGLALVVVMADLLAGFGAAAALILLSTVAYGAIGWLQIQGRLLSPMSPLETLWTDVPALVLGLVVIGVLSRLTTRHFRTVLQYYLTRLQDQAQILDASEKEKTRLAQELHARTEENRHLEETLERLSVSLMPVTDEVLILPLAGAVDVHRMEQITVSLLNGVVARRARVVILELTGVSRFEVGAVEGLVEATRSARLLGCELFLVGMPRRVADDLADLEPLLSGSVILGDLQDGVAWALARLGWRIVATEPGAEFEFGRQFSVVGAETRSVS